MKPLVRIWVCNAGMKFAYTQLSICNTNTHPNCGWYGLVKDPSEEE